MYFTNTILEEEINIVNAGKTELDINTASKMVKPEIDGKVLRELSQRSDLQAGNI